MTIFEKIDTTNFLVVKLSSYEIWTDRSCFTVGRQSKTRGREKGLMQPSYHPTLRGAIQKLSELTLRDRLKQKDGEDKTKTLNSLLKTLEDHDEWLHEVVGEY